jgi:hypothetical protein
MHLKGIAGIAVSACGHPQVPPASAIASRKPPPPELVRCPPVGPPMLEVADIPDDAHAAPTLLRVYGNGGWTVEGDDKHVASCLPASATAKLRKLLASPWHVTKASETCVYAVNSYVFSTQGARFYTSHPCFAEVGGDSEVSTKLNDKLDANEECRFLQLFDALGHSSAADEHETVPLDVMELHMPLPQGQSCDL